MKIITGTILTIFLGLMFVSLFHLSGSMEMSYGMSGKTDCPFMAHEEVVCSMSLSEHIGAWKAVFFTLIPSALTLLLAFGVAVLLTATKPPYLLAKKLLHLLPIHWIRLRRDVIYTYTLRSYQELFASGILHPKLF